MASTLEKGRTEEEQDAENNIIIIDSTVRKIIKTQLKNMSSCYKVICWCECCIAAKIMHYYFLTCFHNHMKQLKYQTHNTQNIRYVEISSHIFETYKNSLRPHGCNIHNSATYMSMAKHYTCTYTHHGLPHWKYVLRSCDKLPNIVIPSQDENKYITNTWPTIIFHVYRNISSCTVHGRHPYKDCTTRSMCSTVNRTDTTEK